MTEPFHDAEVDDEKSLARLRARLVDAYGYDHAAVDAAARASLERFRNVRVREFVMLLVERDTRRLLRGGGNAAFATRSARR